jgi:hypothetical protein
VRQGALLRRRTSSHDSLITARPVARPYMHFGVRMTLSDNINPSVCWPLPPPSAVCADDHVKMCARLPDMLRPKPRTSTLALHLTLNKVSVCDVSCCILRMEGRTACVSMPCCVCSCAKHACACLTSSTAGISCSSVPPSSPTSVLHRSRAMSSPTKPVTRTLTPARGPLVAAGSVQCRSVRLPEGAGSVAAEGVSCRSRRGSWEGLTPGQAQLFTA